MPTQNAVTLDLPDLAATAACGAQIARLLAPRDVVALRGELGAGKTALARAVIRAAAGAAIDVPSPTFTLVQLYELPIGLVWHFDLYRLGDPEEVIELGWDEVRAEGIALVEWPERLGPLLPAERLEVALDFGDAPDARVARLSGGGRWARIVEGW